MAKNLLEEGGFENGGVSWDLNFGEDGFAVVETGSNARSGSGVLRLDRRQKVFGGAYLRGAARSASLGVDQNTAHRFTCYGKSDPGGEDLLTLRFYEGETISESASFSMTPSFVKCELDFTPTFGTTPRVALVLPGGSSQVSVYIDDATVKSTEDQEMAYIGPELAISAMLDMIQDNITTELAEIKTERNDNLDFPATVPDAVFNRPAAAFVGSVLQLEVFSDQTLFPFIDRDLTTWLASSPRVTSEVPLIVRLRFANRGASALSVVNMAKITQRYAAALVRMIRNDPELANGGSPMVEWAKIEGLRISQSVFPLDESSSQYVDTIEMDVSVMLQETDANENTAGGGEPAAFSGGLGLS